ncbi:hypothetical protein Q8F55_004999 [Vanrija albida]|uniref:HMA domain-containing protein n=1 Tax=Vanrija albida TaxID=181172 RepID=A0ABR3Q0G6_9TREE
MALDNIPTHLPTASLLVSNMHCPSCVEAITQLLSGLSSVKNLSISLLLNRVTFAIDTSISSSTKTPSYRRIVDQVKGILATEGGFTVTEEAAPAPAAKPSLFSKLGSKRRATKEERRAEERHARHLERCEACRAEQDALTNGLAPPTVSSPPPADQIQVTTLSIEGMTCASCTGTITGALKGNPSVLESDIILLSSSGKVRHKASLPASEVAELIEDLGYDAQVIETHPEAPDVPDEPDENALIKTTYSIDGMTCASCTSTIESELGKNPDITEALIVLLDNKGVVIHKASLSAEAIKETIEDLGYDATIVTSAPVNGPKKKDGPGLRTVTVRVDGVFCNNCIVQLNDHLKTMPLRSFTPLTLKAPVTTITYAPHDPLTIRDILQSLTDVAPEFDAEVVRNQSLSERSREMQRHEVKILGSHLAVAFLFAIPTFIIGIVSMVLLPKRNGFRQYFMEPVWGGADRGTIALFALATPVQFGVGRLFYIRAFNSVWPHLRHLVPTFLRPKSMANIPSRPFSWRNFFTFGSMDLLVALSTTASYFASVAMMALDVKAGAHSGNMSIGTYFDSSVFLLMFILLGRTLEAYAKSRTTDAVSLLGNLRPPTAWLVDSSANDEKNGVKDKEDDHSEPEEAAAPAREIPVDNVEYGDHILIQAGALPPTDGVIVSGNTTFDESSLTGESLPVAKGPGDEVFTGTTNQSAPVTIRVTNLASDTMLERIIRAVSDASGRKAPLEKAAERLTGVFVPIVVYISIVVLSIWMGVTFGGLIDPKWFHGNGGRAFFALEFAISVLVVACPCGIGLAVPCANAVGNGLAAAAGILASGGGEAFTGATQVTTIAFDKTGTLTVGKSVVTDEFHKDVPGVERKAVVHALRDVEAQSTHPLAVGLVEYLNASFEESNAKVTETAEIAGRGLRALASVGDETLELLIGNAKLLEENGLDLGADDAERVTSWARDAKSVVLVGARVGTASFSLAAMFGLSDPPRPTTKGVLQTLRARGYRLVMLTGDNEVTAHAVARTLDIAPEDVHAGVGPEGKAEAIAAMQAQSRTLSNVFRTKTVPQRVMFVGDGLNDAVALAAADVSAAMGHGSQATLASADFVILSSSLDSLITLFHLSKKVRNRQWLNLVWACVFNFVCLPIAAGVLFPANGIKLSPVWSAVLMALSSVSVVLSSLALRWGL